MLYRSPQYHFCAEYEYGVLYIYIDIQLSTTIADHIATFLIEPNIVEKSQRQKPNIHPLYRQSLSSTLTYRLPSPNITRTAANMYAYHPIYVVGTCSDLIQIVAVDVARYHAFQVLLLPLLPMKH